MIGFFKPAQGTCFNCGKQDDQAAMIDAFNASGDRVSDDWCIGCWHSRGQSPRPPMPEPPQPPHEWADYSASKHPNYLAALARIAKIREYLGLGCRPEIWTPELYAALGVTHWVIGDSPLVPGFKAARNPFKK